MFQLQFQSVKTISLITESSFRVSVVLSKKKIKEVSFACTHVHGNSLNLFHVTGGSILGEDDRLINSRNLRASNSNERANSTRSIIALTARIGSITARRPIDGNARLSVGFLYWPSPADLSTKTTLSTPLALPLIKSRRARESVRNGTKSCAVCFREGSMLALPVHIECIHAF